MKEEDRVAVVQVLEREVFQCPDQECSVEHVQWVPTGVFYVPMHFDNLEQEISKWMEEGAIRYRTLDPSNFTLHMYGVITLPERFEVLAHGLSSYIMEETRKRAVTVTAHSPPHEAAN